MALPNLFIIGAAKAGTTSLHGYLDQHPQIQMSQRKEPNFFSGPERDIPYTFGRISDLAEYEKLFDSTAVVRGEASPSYADHPRREGVPERIKQLVPDAKFVYLVRDPIARTVSHHQHRVANGGERRPLREALSDLSDPCSPCICPSLYASQLDLYIRHFPQERILVVDQADLLADRRSTLRQVLAFLGVDDTFDSQRFDEELNRSSDRRTYPPGLARHVKLHLAPRLRWLPPGVRRPLRRSAERVLLPPLRTETLDDDLRTRLQELYAGEVRRLRALTGKAFPTWSL